jgi:hypothetical protein
MVLFSMFTKYNTGVSTPDLRHLNKHRASYTINHHQRLKKNKIIYEKINLPELLSLQSIFYQV